MVDEGTECWQAEFAGFIGNFFGRSSPLVRVRQKL